jgi:hypothetical protein
VTHLFSLLMHAGNTPLDAKYAGQFRAARMGCLTAKITGAKPRDFGSAQ